MAIIFNSVSSNSVIPAETYSIALPFNISSNSKITTVLDSSPKAWRDRVLSLLSTGINERIWYYNYGANLDGLLYESAANAVEIGRQAVKEMFIAWLPSLTLYQVVPGYDSDTGTLELSIIYKLPSGDTDSVTISTASLTAAGETIKGA
jgi:phage baseplate assembly protein W